MMNVFVARFYDCRQSGFSAFAEMRWSVIFLCCDPALTEKLYESPQKICWKSGAVLFLL